jgi:hypothetical protein
MEPKPNGCGRITALGLSEAPTAKRTIVERTKQRAKGAKTIREEKHQRPDDRIVMGEHDMIKRACTTEPSVKHGHRERIRYHPQSQTVYEQRSLSIPTTPSTAASGQSIRGGGAVVKLGLQAEIPQFGQGQGGHNPCPSLLRAPQGHYRAPNAPPKRVGRRLIASYSGLGAALRQPLSEGKPAAPPRSGETCMHDSQTDLRQVQRGAAVMSDAPRLLPPSWSV